MDCGDLHKGFVCSKAKNIDFVKAAIPVVKRS